MIFFIAIISGNDLRYEVNGSMVRLAASMETTALPSVRIGAQGLLGTADSAYRVESASSGTRHTAKTTASCQGITSLVGRAIHWIRGRADARFYLEPEFFIGYDGTTLKVGWIRHPSSLRKTHDYDDFRSVQRISHCRSP